MKLRLTLAVCVLVVFLQAGQGASDTDTYRLPQTCKPSEYELYIRPDFYDANAKPTFSGSVNITVTCSASTNQMTLHQRNLYFQEVTVTSNGIELPFHGKENTALDFYTLVLGNGLQFKANVPYKLSFTFSGFMGTSSGLFYSSYVSVQGQTVGLAATQLLPNNARSVFPCFDEPGFKATFFASIARRTDTGRDYSTLFNTALDKSEVDPKDLRWTVDVYGPTPLMSTYLVALVVSDFTGYTKKIDLGKLHSGQENGTLLSIRTLGDTGYKRELFPLHVFVGKSFSWMDTHFLPTYEKFLSKIDIVAVPDYPSPSVDSWGVIQCRISDVKYTRFLTPMQTIEKLMWIPYNTIANQWFSSIVSPKWWTYYWLSQGFSTFWQYYGPQQDYPNWKQDELIVSTGEMVTMQKDGSAYSRPLNNPVQIPSLWHLSNQYTVYKGSAVVRMLHMILGEHFLPALNHYLTKHELKAVDSDDLWTALDEYGIEHGLDLQLSERMPPWVEQIGYPVLWANRTKDQERVTLTQEIFPVEHRNTNFNQPFRNKFDIPIQLVTDEDFRRNTSTHPPEWFSRNHCFKTIQVGKDVSWYVVNEDHRGYYRVLYDEDNYEKLYDQLMNDHEVFTPLTRATILDDALTFFRAEDKFRLAVKAWPFVLTRYLKKELSFPAWEVFRREMEHYRPRLMFADRSLFQSFNDFIQSITGPVLKSLGLTIWFDIPPYDSYIRTWVAELACRSRERYCVEYAERAVMGLIEDDRPLNVDQKEALYCGALGGNMTKARTVFKFLVDRLPKVKGSDKKKYLSILGCIREPRLVVWLLTNALNGHIPGLESGGDMWLLLHQFAFSWSPSHTTLEFLVDNFDSILQRINNTQRSYYLLNDVFEYLTENTYQKRILTPLLNNMMQMEIPWIHLEKITRIDTFRKNNEYLNKNRDIFEAWLDTNI